MARRCSFHTFLIVCAVGSMVVGGMGCGPRPAPVDPDNPNHVAEKGKGDKDQADDHFVSQAGKVKPGDTIEVPFIFWGGDVATFVANGGLETKKDSLFGRHDLNVKLTPGDDFDKQVENYLGGKSPFLRGTLSMLGQASEKLTAKQETVPVVFLQLTWSAGDHLVGRAAFKSLNDIKGKKIALQKGGPHVGMLNDVLRTARLGWKDITVVWTDDVSGDKGPATAFRKDPSIDGCFAISPEMSDLTGGLESTGDGAKNTLKGAHVVVSTAQMSHSIADVYACRRDFYEANKDWVEKFAAGYLKACEELVGAKKEAAPKYKDAIHLAQDIWGKDPTLKDSVKAEDDVDGLITDATFVGLPGNISFFTAEGNLTGFGFKTAQALPLPEDPATQSLKTGPKGFRRADFDYAALRKLGGLTGASINQERFKGVEVGKVEPEQKIYTFYIYFEPNKTEFSEEKYGNDFQRALETASLFGNAVVLIRGHASPDGVIPDFITSGKKMGVLKQVGATGKYTLADGTPLDLNNMNDVIGVIEKNPGLTMKLPDGDLSILKDVEYLQTLSEGRAESVRKSVVRHAQSKDLVLDQSQIRFQGAGAREPVYSNPNPLIKAEGEANRRVEFSVLKVPAGKVSDEFGF